MAIARNFVSTAQPTTLSSSLGSSGNPVVATMPGTWPSPSFTAVIDWGTSTQEAVLVTSVTGAGPYTLVCTRGIDGTTAQSHVSGAQVVHAALGEDFNDVQAHIQSYTSGTSGTGSQQVHGLASGSAVVGTTDTQTLTNKTLTSPALTVTPTAPTATALTSSTQVATTAYADSAVGVEKTRAQSAEAAALQASNNLSDVTTRQTALNNLAGATTSGDYLRGTGSNVVMGAIPAADLPAATTSAQGAVQLDNTATDIKALGSQSAGTSSLVPKADHVHPTTGLAQTSNNLSDLGSASAARTNLGLTGAATASLPLSLGNGGTGQITAQLAMDALAGAVTSGDYLRGTGSHVVMSAIVAADLPAATTSAQGAVELDGTSTDIAALGTQAAGSTGKAADAGHVHPPATVPGGGTGDTSLTAYAPLTGGTTTTGAVQSVSSGGATSGQVLTYQGSSSMPTWTTVSGGGGSGSGLTDTAAKTSAYTAAAGDMVLVDTNTAGANVTITTPLSPANKAIFGVKLVKQGNNGAGTFYTAGLVLNGSGSPVAAGFNDDASTTSTVSVVNQSGVYQYDSTLNTWVKLYGDTPLGGIDQRYGAAVSNAYSSAATATPAITVNTAGVWNLTLSTNVTGLTISGATAAVAQTLTLYIAQPSSGGPYTFPGTSWPSSVTWLSGSAPVIASGASAVTVITLQTTNGGTTWWGAASDIALPLSIGNGGTGLNSAGAAGTLLTSTGTTTPGVWQGLLSQQPVVISNASATSALEGQLIPVDCVAAAGNVTVDLPAEPFNGALVGVKMINTTSGYTTTVQATAPDIINRGDGFSSGTATTSLPLSHQSQGALLSYYAPPAGSQINVTVTSGGSANIVLAGTWTLTTNPIPLHSVVYMTATTVPAGGISLNTAYYVTSVSLSGSTITVQLAATSTGSAFTMSSAGISVGLQPCGIWTVVSDDLPLPQLDLRYAGLAGATFTGYSAPAVVSLSASSNLVAVNAALGNDFRLTLTSSSWTISNPTSAVDGQTIKFQIAQDGTGSRTVAWGTAYDFGAGSAPTLSTGINKVDIAGFVYNLSLTKWCYLGSGLGF